MNNLARSEEVGSARADYVNQIGCKDLGAFRSLFSPPLSLGHVLSPIHKMANKL